MMRVVRPVVALSLGLSLLVAGHAGAAPAKSCGLIKDAAGDAADLTGQGVQVAPANDKMKDIIGGDFAANASTVTGMIKLAEAPGLDPQAPGGLRLYVEFSPSSVPDGLFLRATTNSSGALTYAAGHIGKGATGKKQYNPDADIIVRGKAVGATIVMTVKTKDLKPLLATFKPGSKITKILASTFGVASTPAGNFLLPGDESATVTKPYVFGTKSCLAPV